MRRRGMSEKSILAALLEENRTACNPPLDDAEVSTIAKSVSKYEPEADQPVVNLHVPLSLNILPARKDLAITQEELDRAHLTPKCIVENYLFADVAVLAAPGGVGKTTLTIYEAIAITLGHDLWGQKIISTGWILIVTAEDQREIFLARLREVMAALDLTKVQRQKVFSAFCVWDVVGQEVKLTCARDGNLGNTGLADLITDRYREDPPVMVIFDPLVSFGVDEEKVNTNEQALVTAARRIVRGLGCCVRLIHHTGKANARNKTTDQYSSRGGSALSDGARMVTVFQPWEQGDDGTPPPFIKGGKSILTLTRAKLSYAPPQPLIWIARDGYNFSYALNLPISLEEQDKARVDQVERYLASQTKDERYHTQKTLEESSSQVDMTRAELRRAVNELKLSNRLIDRDLPANLKQGGRKTYLHPTVLDSNASNSPKSTSPLCLAK